MDENTGDSGNNGSNSPDKIFAVATKCRLFKKSGHKLMIFNNVDILLFQCSLTTSNFQSELCFAGIIIIMVIGFFISHGRKHDTTPLSATPMHTRMFRNGK